MTTTELREKVAQLIAVREVAREKATQDPRRAQAEEMRDQIVKAKLATRRNDPNAPTTDDLKAAIRTRDELVAAIMSEVNAIGVELTGARRGLRVSEAKDYAESYASISTEQLTEELANCTRQRREFKVRQRAIRTALASREALAAAKAFLPKLDASQLAALRAELEKVTK